MKNGYRIYLDEDKLDRELLASGLRTRTALAEASGIHLSSISALGGSSNFRMETLARLAIALDINPIDLLSFDGFPPPKPGSPNPGL